jgi:hypothetical protein
MNRDYKLQIILDNKAWDHYFLSVKNPNLSQSWHYGNAKMQAQGWKIIRCVITENDKPIALIQAWNKKFLFLKFVRISYGPLWIIDNPLEDQIQKVFQIIKNKWSLKKFSLLFIAPNLENTPENIAILKKLRFYKRKSMAFESGLVNLTLIAHDLRASLRKNWRRHLNASEKMGLDFHISNHHTDFQWMISCFETLRKEKNFYGHSVPLLTALHNNTLDFNGTSVGIVSQSNERVAGILIAYHGSSCTPLVSWISEHGRELHAGNFLIWNSVLFAKTNGCSWFDLGGTNNSTPFKTGLPHTPYQLIGEYFGFL